MTIRISRRSLIVAVLATLLIIPSVALGNHVFDDVGDSGAHVNGIEWLAGTGVTAGCGGNDYCPNDAVNRAQMATFMHRLSGNASGVAPSVDAAYLGGYGPSTFTHRFSESIAFGDSAVLATNGPLSIFANCVLDDAGTDYLRFFVESTASGSYYFTTPLTANVAVEISSFAAATGSLGNSLFFLFVPMLADSGETLTVQPYSQVVLNGGGHDCFVTGSIQTN